MVGLPPNISFATIILTFLVMCAAIVAHPALAQPSFQDAFDKQGTVMMLIDPQSGEIIDANVAATKFYGYSRDTLRAMTIQEINQLTPDQVAEERSLAATEGRNFFIFRHKLSTGDIRTVEVHSVPLDFEGRTLLFSIIHDISKQRSLQDDLWHYQTRLEDLVDLKTREVEAQHKRTRLILVASVIGLSILVVLLLIVMRMRQKMDKALRTSEIKQRSILSSAAEGIYGLNSQGLCTFANPACVHMLGYDDESELLGQSMHDLIHHTHADGRPHNAEDCPIHKAYREGTEAHTEDDIFWRKDGDSFPVEYWAHPLYEDGSLVGSVLSFIDISERKHAENLLLEAKQNAERANEAKSNFMASMSHDLRTPLNAILGFAQLLKLDTQTPLSNKQTEQVERILEGGNHLLALVNDILDLAKIETDQVSIILEEVAANDIVAECAEMAMNLGNLRDISVHNKLASHPRVMLRTDHQRLMQILLNLMNNAIKFNHTGGSVTITGEDVGNGYYRISVADTGVGIPQDEYDKVFQMFHRVEKDPLLAHEGTGIGLTVSRMLAERLGGRLGFDSTVGVGSTFWLELPLTSNTEALVWSDSLRLGVEALDRDHQILIALLNKITLDCEAPATTEKVIRDLEDYTRSHFKREERVMELCGFSGLDEHRRSHERITKQLAALAQQWRTTSDANAKHDLQAFLRTWLAGHIMGDDNALRMCIGGKEDLIQTDLQNEDLL